MFSEYYFYMAALIDDEKVRENFNVINDSFPTIWKKIQFMYGERLRKIKFKYFGYSVEAILDRLPTAKILDEEPHEDGKRTVYTISAEVFGDGIDMWLRSQGDNIVVLS